MIIINILLKYLLRCFAKKKIRTIVVILSLGIIAATILVNLSTSRIISQTYNNMIQNSYGDIQIAVSQKSKSFFSIDDIDMPTDLIEKRVEVINALGITKLDSGKNMQINVFGSDITQMLDANMVELASSSKLDDEDSYFIISEYCSQKYNWHVGDTITLNINGMELEFDITNIANNYGIFYDEKSTVNCIISRNDINEKLKLNNLVNNIYLGTDKDVVNECVDYLKEKNSMYDISNVYDKDTVRTLITNVNMILLFVLILVGFMGTMIIVSLYSHILEERIPVIGTFRSIGINQRIANKMILLESMIYGIVGAVIGQVIGFMLIKLFINNIFSMMEASIVADTNVRIIDMLLSFGYTIIWTLFIACFYIIKISSKDIRSVIIENEQKPFVLKKSNTLIGTILTFGSVVYFLCFHKSLNNNVIMYFASVALIMGIMLLFQNIIYLLGFLFVKIAIGKFEKYIMAIRNLCRNKILMKCIYVMAVIYGFTISILIISSSVDQVFAYVNEYSFDVIVGVDKNIEKDYDAIKELDTVKDAYYLYTKKIQMHSEDENIKVSLISRYKNDSFDEYLKGSIKVNQSEIDQLQNDEIILDKQLLQRLNVNIGDCVECIYDEKSFELKIVGIMDSYYFSSDCCNAVVGKQFYEENITNIPATIYVNSTSDIQDTVQEISDYLLDTYATVETKKDFYGQQQKNNEAILLIVKISLLLGVVIGFIGVLNNIWMGYTKRKKEFAIYISTSMNGKLLLKQISIEILFSAISVGLLLELYSFIITFVLEKVLDALNLHLEIKYSWYYSIGILIIAFVVYFGSYFIPRKIVANLNVLNELKQKNE